MALAIGPIVVGGLVLLAGMGSGKASSGAGKEGGKGKGGKGGFGGILDGLEDVARSIVKKNEEEGIKGPPPWAMDLGMQASSGEGPFNPENIPGWGGGWGGDSWGGGSDDDGGGFGGFGGGGGGGGGSSAEDDKASNDGL